jgi:hypothetical protein
VRAVDPGSQAGQVLTGAPGTRPIPTPACFFAGGDEIQVDGALLGLLVVFRAT